METKIAEHNSLYENSDLKLELFNKTIAFAQFDSTGFLCFANDNYLKMHGYSSEEAMNMHHDEFLPEHKRNRFWQKLLKGGRREGEFLRIKKDGTFIWIKAEYHIIPTTNENTEIYLIVTDISEHKRSQLQLSQQLATLHLAAIVSETDQTGKITFINQEFCKVSKYSEHELLGQTHSIVKSGIQPEPIYKELWETITSGKVWQGVLCNKTKDGAYYWEHITISPFMNLQNEVYKYVSVGFNITEQVTQKITLKQRSTALKRKHQDLEKINRELDKAYQHKTEFLANMSHELRTPLNSILLLSKLLMENNHNNLEDEEVEYAAIINSSGSNLLELINDVLDASKFEAGRMEAHENRFSLQTLVSSVDSSFAKHCESKNLYYYSNVQTGSLDACFGDRLRIQQILKNLLSNAVKFTETGTVQLLVDTVGTEKERQVRFRVLDTGIGISAESLPQIFKAFRQVDGSNSRKYEGTGLGLSISKNIAHLLGGTLDVTSEINKGSVFTLTLPIIKKTPSKTL